MTIEKHNIRFTDDVDIQFYVMSICKQFPLLQRPLAERIVSALINVLGPRAQYITPITTVSELFDLCDYFNDPILLSLVLE